MASRLKDIEFGSASIKDLAYWINERHSIFVNRFEKELPKPWTDDPIFQQYRFTNAFRQLDKGTIALRNMLMWGQDNDPALIFFNVVWYRLFNWYEHAKYLGFVETYEEVENYIQKQHRLHRKIFTGAHMTGSAACEDKYTTYLRACKEAWNWKEHHSQFILNSNSMEQAFNELLSLYMVGRFVAYELVCDMRFTSLLETATDKLTWANMGPGAQRGLHRLGLLCKNQKEGLRSMRFLYRQLPKYLSDRVLLHFPKLNMFLTEFYTPFELREVEHSLCEFDKYQRVKLGEGRPRSKYDGMP